MSSSMTLDSQYLLDLVSTQDHDRYLTALFAPAEHRTALLALYAFNCEVSRIREVVNGPLPGEVRLQWWRDFLEGNRSGEGAANPVASALGTVIEQYHLPHKTLINLLDARVFDLYEDPMPTLNDLEGYAGETSSALMSLAAIILAGGKTPDVADAAGHGGVAYALAGLMRALPWHASRRQQYLPTDLMERHQVDVESVFRGKATAALRAALNELRGHVRFHVEKTAHAVKSLDPRVAPAILPVCLVEPLLKKMEASDFDPLHSAAELSGLRKQWIIWRSARKAGCRLENR